MIKDENKKFAKDVSQNRNKPELVAPAGDLEKLKVAFLYGADASLCLHAQIFNANA